MLGASRSSQAEGSMNTPLVFVCGTGDCVRRRQTSANTDVSSVTEDAGELWEIGAAAPGRSLKSERSSLTSSSSVPLLGASRNHSRCVLQGPREDMPRACEKTRCEMYKLATKRHPLSGLNNIKYTFFGKETTQNKILIKYNLFFSEWGGG